MINKKLNYKCVERLKQCIEESHMTQKELSERTSYTAQYISNIIHGKRNASSDALITFAKALNVRKEYLLCEDDYKTAEDERKALRISDIESIGSALSYIKSLGYTLRSEYIATASILMLHPIFRKTKDFIIKDDFERLNKKYDFSLTHEKFVQLYGVEQEISDESFRVNADFPGLPNSLNSRSNYANFFCVSAFFEPCCERLYFCTVNPVYKLYKDNQYIKSIFHRELLRFLDILDNFTKCTVENILLNQRILPFEQEDIISKNKSFKQEDIISKNGTLADKTVLLNASRCGRSLLSIVGNIGEVTESCYADLEITEINTVPENISPIVKKEFRKAHYHKYLQIGKQGYTLDDFIQWFKEASDRSRKVSDEYIKTGNEDILKEFKRYLDN